MKNLSFYSIFMLPLLLAGCFEVEAQFDFHSDGTYDSTVTFQ